MKNYRIFVEKYPRFQVEAETLRKELNNNLGLHIGALRLLNVYDLFGFSEELLERSRYAVFVGRCVRAPHRAYGRHTHQEL